MWYEKPSAWVHGATLVRVQSGQELLLAVESVMQGKQFISSGLDGHGDPSSFREVPGGDGTT